MRIPLGDGACFVGSSTGKLQGMSHTQRSIVLGICLSGLMVSGVGCKKQADGPPAKSVAEQIKMADARLAADGFDGAKAMYNKILEASPNNSPALRGLGAVEVQQGNFEAALPFLKKAVAADAKNGEAHATLGFAQEQLKQYAAAATSYGQAHTLDQDHSEWTVAYGRNLRLSKKLAEAEKVLTQLAKDDPDVRYVYTEIGDTQREAGRLEDALRSYMKAQKQHASDKKAWAGAAQVYEAQGETTLALNEWSEYIRRDCCSPYSKNVAHKRLARLKKIEESGGKEK